MSQEPKRQPQMVDCASTVSFTLRELLVYFLRLGTLGFGGPIALAGHMQKDLVEERDWVSKQDYLEGLAFSQLSRTARCTVGNVPRVATGRNDRGHGCPHRLYLAFFPDGACRGRSLCSLWQPAVDSGNVLRHRSGGDCDHRAEHDQTCPHNSCRSCWSSPTRKSGMSIPFSKRALISACFLVPGVLCLSSSFLTGQSQPNAQAKERQNGVQEPLRTASASRIGRAPKLDGTLDDPAWQQATPISKFLQREPFEGQTPTEKTEVRTLYDRHEVYFGITCFDSDPKRIVATELRRDVPQELDDYFEIIIDSAHHRRNAYVFQINPLGTQRDALITEEQRTDRSTGDGDPGWDGVWTSEARITKQGWTATIAIPFTTLNFMQSRDVIWGINFKRFVRRKNEEDLWSGWRRTYGAARISQAGELHGISEIGSGRLFIVKPYLLLR